MVRPPGRRAPLVLTLLLGLACGPAACGGQGSGGGPEAPEGPSSTSSYAVTGVIDGDTIRVRFQGREQRVRLIGIDTPEVPWYGGRAGCFGVQAGEYTKRRLTGARVRFAFDVDRRDRYGRLLAYVYLGRELYNLTLVERGYARVEAVAPDTRFAPAFARAQTRAEAAGLGVWSACPSR